MKLLIGGPGTGKTYTLINKIQEIKPERFALLSFTRQAANEAKQRLKQFYSNKDLDYIRTIHSLAFKCLGLKKEQIFSFEHQRDFGKEHGFNFSGRYKNEEDDTYEGLTEDDIIWRIMNMYSDNEIYYDEIQFMRLKYTEYKTKKMLLDFNDMLERAVNFQLPSFDLLCVDETQDLSPLQFAVIDKLMKNCKEVIFAGDDDQMIYEWAGVKREYFMELYNKSETDILTDNHRLPDEIIVRSVQVIERCRNRIHKTYNKFGTTNSKSFHRINDLSQIAFNPNLSYLILVRNSYFLHDIKLLLDELGIFWDYLSYSKPNSGFRKDCNIRLSTIHGSKGSEADVVILLTDVSNATYENITKDSEHRVWYVGMTRAKKQLIIVEPQSELYYAI